jgi:hypothetical protein
MNVRLIEPAIEDGSYCWLVELGAHRAGINAESGWCVRLDGRIVTLDTESNLMPLGPLLDVPEAEFTAFLQRSAKAMPLRAQQVLAFPKEALLKHIFHTSHSSYWPERALAWLVADQGLWSQFKDELKTFSNNKVMPQAARQHATRLLRATDGH